MPVSVGPPEPAIDFVDILLACHDRIRRFADSAVRLAAPDAAPGEVRDAASRIRYYFRAAFPSHVDDENDTLLPRLLGADPAVDEALHTMERDHDGHAAPLARLLALCDALVEDPARHSALRDELAALAAQLHAAFSRHLAMEEASIFPAIRDRLPATVQAELLYEARARRGDG